MPPSAWMNRPTENACRSCLAASSAAWSSASCCWLCATTAAATSAFACASPSPELFERQAVLRIEDAEVRDQSTRTWGDGSSGAGGGGWSGAGSVDRSCPPSGSPGAGSAPPGRGAAGAGLLRHGRGPGARRPGDERARTTNSAQRARRGLRCTRVRVTAKEVARGNRPFFSSADGRPGHKRFPARSGGSR